MIKHALLCTTLQTHAQLGGRARVCVCEYFSLHHVQTLAGVQLHLDRAERGKGETCLVLVVKSPSETPSETRSMSFMYCCKAGFFCGLYRAELRPSAPGGFPKHLPDRYYDARGSIH